MEQSVPYGETQVLWRELEVLREERERERNQLQDTISDLQKDRDHWRQQATYLLENKREKEEAAHAQLEKVRSSWIGRWLLKV